MQAPLLEAFRLVRGTALSLLKGHRISVDIDLFTDQEYGTTNFRAIEQWIERSFPVVQPLQTERYFKISLLLFPLFYKTSESAYDLS